MDNSVTIKTIIFEGIPLKFAEIDYLRKAICSVISKLRTSLLQFYVAPDLFHNHDEISNKNINRYPLIQYKVINGKAAITGINQGAYAIKVLLQLLLIPQNKPFNAIHINGRDATLVNSTNLRSQKHSFSLLDEPKEYRIENWLPLEDDRYSVWKDSLDMNERLAVLNECLPRQIALLLQGAGYDDELRYRAVLSGIDKTGWLKEFKVNKLAFDCTFSCNLDLPTEVGIGQVPSIGFGRILKIVKN